MSQNTLHASKDSVFTGAPIDSLCCFELCAGCARLSLALSTKGFKVTAVDQKSNRHKQMYPTIALDLADDEAVHYMSSLLKQKGLVFYFHCAPPCGTASRARERRLSKKLRSMIKEPRPLRSPSFPHGLPSLQGLDLHRVTTANAIYKNLALLAEVAILNGCFISVENPTRSYMWQTKWFQRLIKKFNLFEVKFQQCMWGGKRDKWSSFYTNAKWLLPLEKTCDGSHNHLPWGVGFSDGKFKFNTAEEAEYPPLLCSTIASLAYDAALDAGCQLPNHTTKKRKSSGSNSSLKAAAGRQPRGNKLPEVIPEFDYTLESPWCLPPPNKVPRLLQGNESEHFSLTHPAKLLSYIPSGETTDESHCGMAKIGVYRSCDKFTSEALKLVHPFDDDSTLDDAIKSNIYQLLTKGCEWMASYRQKQMAYYEARACELAAREQALHDGMPPSRAVLVKDKRFLLFQEMCVDAGVDDEGILDLQVLGTPLVGRSGTSSLFETEENSPAMTPEQLMKSSRWSRKMLLGRSMAGSGDIAEVASDIWNGALEEVEKGWLQGPFTEDQVVDLLGPLFVASPRFGLKQSDKLSEGN